MDPTSFGSRHEYTDIRSFNLRFLSLAISAEIPFKIRINELQSHTQDNHKIQN